MLGVGAVAGLVIYLIWQQTQASGTSAAQLAEADSSADLPGVWVDLPALYGGPYGDTASHVRREVDYSDQDDTPPVGGPHWGSSGCAESAEESPPFCGPAPWGIYREPWDEETLIHNLEHGGVVLWYNTTDQAIIDELEGLFEDRLKGDEILLVMAPYPEMEDETIAITAWSRRDKFPVSEYTKERVEHFIDVHLCRFNPEDMTGCGN
ncbi:MAG: DUF3105 domain-containing protein [Chloroflexi bacterium]|nr:DUF3105 domain-containing protein [Chloroflexota bacterium]